MRLVLPATGQTDVRALLGVHVQCHACEDTAADTGSTDPRYPKVKKQCPTTIAARGEQPCSVILEATRQTLQNGCSTYQSVNKRNFNR